MPTKETDQKASQEGTVSQGRERKVLQEKGMVIARDRGQGEIGSY